MPRGELCHSNISECKFVLKTIDEWVNHPYLAARKNDQEKVAEVVDLMIKKNMHCSYAKLAKAILGSSAACYEEDHSYLFSEIFSTFSIFKGFLIKDSIRDLLEVFQRNVIRLFQARIKHYSHLNFSIIETPYLYYPGYFKAF